MVSMTFIRPLSSWVSSHIIIIFLNDSYYIIHFLSNPKLSRSRMSYPHIFCNPVVCYPGLNIISFIQIIYLNTVLETLTNIHWSYRTNQLLRVTYFHIYLKHYIDYNCQYSLGHLSHLLRVTIPHTYFKHYIGYFINIH